MSRANRIQSNELTAILDQYNVTYDYKKGIITENEAVPATLTVSVDNHILFEMVGVNDTYGDLLISKSAFISNLKQLRDYKIEHNANNDLSI